jgi:DNA polymerase III alpha subunit
MISPRRCPGRCTRAACRGRRLPAVTKLARREALWAIKALHDEPLPLFAAASAREAKAVPELRESKVALRPMSAGGEVVEDYGHVGLTLRSHPVSFSLKVADDHTADVPLFL